MKKILNQILSERDLQERPYQVRNIIDYLAPNKPHVYAAATAAGKTYTTAAKFELYYRTGILKKNDKVLIIPSDKTVLRGNFVEQFNKFFKDKIASFTWTGVEDKNELYESIENDIQVIIALPQLVKDHTKVFKNVKWLVIDEAHKWYFAPTIKNIVKQIKPKYQFLLTGTPFKFNLRKEDYIIDYTSVSSLYNQGFIGDVNMQVLHTSLSLSRMDWVSMVDNLKSDKRISKKDLDKSFTEVINELIKMLKLPKKNYTTFHNVTKNALSVFGKLEKTIIFMHGIPEANIVANYLQMCGVKCLITHSELKDEIAEKTFKEFKEVDDIKVLVSVVRGREGFDFPNLCNIIDMTYSQNFEVVMQMIGRLLREGKNNKSKVFYKVAPRNTEGYFTDWMDCLIQLFDDYWYSRFTGKNAFEIRVPNTLLQRNKKGTKKTTKKKGKKKGKFKPKNLEQMGFDLSLSFMERNSWFRLDDPLSTVATTTLRKIMNKFDDSNISNRFKKELLFLSFNECKDYLKTIDEKWKTSKMWSKYCTSGEKPEYVPSSPFKVYKNEWKGWDDWFNTGFLPLEEAIKFVHKLKFNSEKEWREYCKSGEKPNNIPSNYRSTYNGISSADFFGHGRISDNLKKFKTLKEIKILVKDLKINSKTEWFQYWKNNKRPLNIPSDPSRVYNNEWKGWSDFFNKEKVIYWSFNKSKKFVKSLKLNNTIEYREFCKSKSKPKELPSSPDNHYGKLGLWTNWPDFLGTNVTPKKYKGRTYKK